MSAYFETGTEFVEAEVFSDPDGHECVGFDCPGCGRWGVVNSRQFGEIDTAGGSLSVEEPVVCGDRIATDGCGWSARIRGGRAA